MIPTRLGPFGVDDTRGSMVWVVGIWQTPPYRKHPTTPLGNPAEEEGLSPTGGPFFPSTEPQGFVPDISVACPPSKFRLEEYPIRCCRPLSTVETSAHCMCHRGMPVLQLDRLGGPGMGGTLAGWRVTTFEQVSPGDGGGVCVCVWPGSLIQGQLLMLVREGGSERFVVSVAFFPRPFGETRRTFARCRITGVKRVMSSSKDHPMTCQHGVLLPWAGLDAAERSLFPVFFPRLTYGLFTRIQLPGTGIGRRE